VLPLLLHDRLANTRSVRQEFAMSRMLNVNMRLRPYMSPKCAITTPPKGRARLTRRKEAKGLEFPHPIWKTGREK
jgi:hypothetical protein